MKLIIAAILVLVTALTVTLSATAGGKHHPPPVKPPPVVPPTPTCDHSVMAGKDGQPGNDDCAELKIPVPPHIVTPVCPEGTTAAGSSNGVQVCERTIVKYVKEIRYVDRVKVKRVVQYKTRTKIHVIFRQPKHCPTPPRPPAG